MDEVLTDGIFTDGIGMNIILTDQISTDGFFAVGIFTDASVTANLQTQFFWTDFLQWLL